MVRSSMKLPTLLLSLAALSATSGAAQSGIPYSAQQVTERVQTLADGTRITQKPHRINLYRDSLGRTRSEDLSSSDTESDEITSASIIDPVAGVRYSLDPSTHLARQWSLAKPPATAASAAQKHGEGPQISRETLGTQTIEGFPAQGTRTTTVYPVGSFGNDRPVTVIREVWRSPELQIVLLSTVSDPRNGDTVTRLTNISRSQPDPSLFQLPAGYQVINAGTSPAPRQAQ
jgi:hypothetical protein